MGQVVEMRDVAKLVLTALIVRLLLAPFLLHPWDMTTIQNSLNLFFNGSNPYTFFSAVTRSLQFSTGSPIFFEGYAYLPHLLYIYSPFYALYLFTGANPTPINGVIPSNMPTNIWFSPDIFLFSLLIKLSIIFADLLAVYLLYKFKPSLASLYAFSPYVIFITAIWGMFDALVGVSLLLSILLFQRYKFLSGFSFGLSLVKPLTILAAPILLAAMLRKKDYKGLAIFIVASLLIQMPTLYYLAVDSSSFLSDVVYFQLQRIGGGITPLNIIWNIPDLLFDLVVTNYVSILFLACYIVLLVFFLRKKVSLEYSVIAAILLYMMFGKVINEQFLVILYPLLLLKLGEFTRSLDKYLIGFAMLRSTPIYFALPILGLFNSSIVATWYSFLAIDYVNFARFFLMFLVSVLFFLHVAEFVWLDYMKWVRNRIEIFKAKWFKHPITINVDEVRSRRENFYRLPKS